MMMKAVIPGCLLLIACSVTFAEPEEVADFESDVPDKIVFYPPSIPEDSILAVFFKSSDKNNFVSSSAMKDGVEADIAKYDGKWEIEVPKNSAILEDYSLVFKSEGKHYGVSTKLNREFKFDAPEFVLQYEVKFLDGLTCGGAYVKLLSASPDLDLSKLTDKTPYTIMFGPDKCGQSSKIHFIFRHKSPKTGEIEEKHSIQTTKSLESYFTDKRTHLFTLVIRNDNSFEISVDHAVIKSGSLLSDVIPSVNPPTEIDDSEDKKPSDWDEREKIADETATKPEDWDEDAPATIIDESAVMPSTWLENEPTTIDDPESEQPEDWDIETDGDWEAPKIENPACKDASGCGPWSKPEIANPKYKGKWSRPMIDNPAYKGLWKPKQIANPNYFEDKEPYKMMPIAALGLEVWTMSAEIVFDNFYIGTSKKDADSFAAQTWDIKLNAEKAADPASKSVVDAVGEAFTAKPWLIGVVIACALVPLGLLLYCCCRSSPSENASAADPAHYKKTDAHVPDDDNVKETLEEDEEEEHEEEEKAVDSQDASDEKPDEEDKEEDDELEKKPVTRQRTRKE